MSTNIKKIEDIESIEMAYNITGRDYEASRKLIDQMLERDRKHMQGYYDRIAITEAFNQVANGGERWFPNYTDGSYKYEVWVWIAADEAHPSGSGFSDSNYDNTNTNTNCSSHLCENQIATQTLHTLQKKTS